MAPRSQRAPSPASVWLVWCCAVGCSVPVTVSGDGRTDGGAGQRDGGNGAAPGVVEIAPGGATFVGRQTVTLKSSAGRRIHYTVDGTAPTLESPVYAGPLVLEGPAQVRAIVDGGLQAPGATASASFVPIASELRGWTSNLPVLLLHTHDAGPLEVVENGPRIPGSASLLVPGPGGRTALVGSVALSARAGLRIRGASSVMFPQKSYAVELREPGSDEDGARSLLGLPSESDWALVGAAFMDRSLIRNALAYAVSNSIGRWAPRTRFVEVFLVEHGGAVRAADYKGVYTLAETIKRDPARVNIAKLDPDAVEGPALTGGYIMRIDKGVPHFSVGMTRFQYVYPEWEEIGVQERAPQRTYLEGYLRDFLDALGSPNFRNPRTSIHYREYIDVPAFIDHNLIVALLKNIDGLRLSAYFHKDLNGKLAAGPVWDFDRSAGTPFDDPHYSQPRAREPREWARDDSTHPLMWGFWGRLFSDPEFKTAHAARWDELARGPMSVPTLHKLVDGLAAEIREAQGRHFARWPDMPATAGSHEAEIRLLKEWLSARVPWMSEQL